MFNPTLAQALHTNNQRTTFGEVGLEGVETLTQYFTEFTGLLKGRYAGLLNDIKPTNVKSDVPKALVDLLNTVQDKEVSDLLIFKPVGMGDYMVPWLRFLTTTMTKFTDMEKRLYVPMSRYFADLLTQSGGKEKPWVARDLVLLDVKEITSVYQSFVDDTARNRHDNPRCQFKDVYRSNDDYLEAGKLVHELAAIINGVDIKRMRDQQAQLGERINSYVDGIKEGAYPVLEDKNNLRMLVNAVNAIAQETELFSLLYYVSLSTQTAFSSSNDALLKALK